MFEEKLLEPHFTSVLAPYMLDVVEQKRALGNKYNAGVEALSAFDDFCNEQQLRIPAISKELLQKWEKKRPHENETTQCFRISYVRILCKYLHSNGYDAPCAFHPAPHVNKCFVPYIFTKDEIERLFSAVDCTKESSESPLRHLVMPVLFRLLYTCGLRVSEALHLKVADVDLDAGVLAIYGAKGDKERLVGISDSMLTYMKSYRSNPLVANAKSIYFFPAPDGGFYDTSTIYDIFRKCLFDAGIPHRGRGKGPRLHDLRHSFAVHILNKWSSEGKDIYTCLPILRTALGHDRITTTEKYLRLVPEAYMEVTEPLLASTWTCIPQDELTFPPARRSARTTSCSFSISAYSSLGEFNSTLYSPEVEERKYPSG